MVQAPRAALLNRLLEADERDRAGLMLDRLDGPTASAIVDSLSPAALRRLATFMADGERAARVQSWGFAATLNLVRHATDESARRILRTLPRARASRVLMGLERDRRQALALGLDDEPPLQLPDVIAPAAEPEEALVVQVASAMAFPPLRLVRAAGE